VQHRGILLAMLLVEQQQRQFQFRASGPAVFFKSLPQVKG
jgi:hypothetical protein